MMFMRLIIFSGLPGTGKSSLADEIGRELGIPVFSKDWLEAALRLCGLGQTENEAQVLGYAGYELLTTLTERQLRLGQSVILDSVASFEPIRMRWRKLAYAYNADWRVVECICSDEVEHRARITNRQRDIPGWQELTWADVERVKSYYAPWTEERLVIDGVQSLETNLELIRNYLQFHPHSVQ
jgi:predicted kinase